MKNIDYAPFSFRIFTVFTLFTIQKLHIGEAHSPELNQTFHTRFRALAIAVQKKATRESVSQGGEGEGVNTKQIR